VRAVFGEKKQNSVWADWRTLTALAGTDLWSEQAKVAAADLEQALGMPVAFRQFCCSSYGFTDPPAWGDAARYLRAMAKCRYYVGVGRGSGPGQGLCDAVSLGCICLGERNKPFHRMICHPCCLCDSKDDIPLMLKRIAASVELQEEILVWQDKMLREHFVEKPLAVLNRAVEIKAGKTPRRWSKQQNITLFSIPKAFRGDDAVRQRNAIKSWMLLEPQPEIILCGDDEGVAEVASEFGLSHLPDVRRNGYGTPLVSDLFEKAQVSASHDVLVYVNADIILLNDFMPAVHRCGEYFDEFLMVGRRWDADVSEPIDFDAGDWQDRLRRFIHTEAFLHAATGIDYFVFTRYLWPIIPDFGLGRTVWDNWLVGKPIGDGKPVVDATDAVTAIHQNHKFVPFGRRREEETVNLTLAGGSDSLRFTTHAAWKVTPYGVVARHVGEILEDNDFGAALMCMAGVFQQAPETVRRQYESYVSYTRPERLKRIADAAKSLLSLNAKNGNLRRLLSQLHQIDRAKLITATRPDSRANTATEALFDKGVNNLSPGNDRQVSGAFDRASQTRAQIPHVDGARTAACVGHGAASLAAEVCGAAFAGQYERGGAGRPPRQIHSGVAEPEQSPDLQVEAGYICSPAERAEREAHSEYGPLGLLPSRCWPASSSLQSARRTTEQDSSGKNTGGKCRQMLETLPSEKARLVDVEPRDVMAAKQTLKSYYCSRLGNVWQSAGAPVWFDHEIDYHLWPKNLFWIERGVFGRLVMSPGCKVLDLCCGDGYFSDIWFSTIAGHIDACDNDEDALRFAAQRHLNAKVAYHRVNILTQPLPSTDYDVVAWFEGIEHFSEQQIGQVLEKIRSSLASGGRLVGSTPLVTRQGRCGNRQHDREFDSQGDLEGVLKIVFGDVRTWATVYPGRTTCYFHASE
ncbi:MAG: class I SAM-dependent methyltransferase, partial [Phycisphaerales bacterium]